MSETLFEAKKRLYPQKAKGKYRKIKNYLNFFFLLIYFLTPFIRFKRGENISNQAIFIDLTSGKGYFFFIEMWPKDVFYLAIILIISALLLFFVTSLFGRIWCGYSCFQTVWTDIFIYFERIFQGDRNERILLDRKNNFTKFYKKFLTHLSWIIFSIATGIGFVAYFNDVFYLYENIFNLKLSVYLWILGVAAMTYIMAGFAREHVCTYMCPYSRFQSAMFDDNTLIITYDQKRGEPRTKLKKSKELNLVVKSNLLKNNKINSVKTNILTVNDGIEISASKLESIESKSGSKSRSEEGYRLEFESGSTLKSKNASIDKEANKIENNLDIKAGDCIDCNQCVVVCPTGIDIRNGLQMECIACGLCVDACDDVMKKIGRPTGLIRYDTQKNIDFPSLKNKFRILKPRTYYYSAILLIIIAIFLKSLIFSPKISINTIPNRNPLFIKLSDGSIRNDYTIKITNKTHEKKFFVIEFVDKVDGNIKFKVYNNEREKNIVIVDPSSIYTGKFDISIDDNSLPITNKINLKLIDLNTKEEILFKVIFTFKK